MTAPTGNNSDGLLTAIKAGNEFAFGEAFRLYKDKLYAYFLHKTGNAEDAADLVQNTFTKLWQYRKSISPDFLFDQQLFHIARTALIDHLRRENKRAKIRRIAKDNEILPQATHDVLADFDCRNRLENALSELPETRRKVFYLNRIQGYSYREIAAILSISVKAADNNLSKAVRQLKNLIAVSLVFFLH